MSDDFTLDPETAALLASAQASRKPNAGTPDDPYDLSAPASVIIPVSTPLVNAMQRISCDENQTEHLSVSMARLKPTGAATNGDENARTFSELVMALKAVEQLHIARKLSNWAYAHGMSNDPIWNAAYLCDVTHEQVQRLCGLARIGVAQDYQGYTEDLGDAVRFTVTVRIAVLIQEPAVPATA